MTALPFTVQLRSCTTQPCSLPGIERHLTMPCPPQAARDVLLGACLAMQQRGMAATPTLLSLLRLVHSYLLVRILVRQGDHMAAARLLLLVAVSAGLKDVNLCDAHGCFLFHGNAASCGQSQRGS